MNYLKNIGFSILIWFVVFLFLSFFNTLLNYFDLYNYSIYVVISFIILIFASLGGGFNSGIHSLKRGYLEGIKFGLIIVLISLFVNMFNGFIFNFKNIIFYLVVLISSMLGSMIGVQMKKSS